MIGCIIQARMGSTRLPKKVMKNLDKNNTVLDFVLTQIGESTLIDKLVVATTILPEDDVIKNFDSEKFYKLQVTYELDMGNKK